MNKIVIWVLGILVVVVLGTFGAYIAFCPSQNIIKRAALVSKGEPVSEKNATYQINGMSVTLKNGVSEVETAPGSVSKIITKYFGNEVRHDFNGDGREDVAFILTQETGGSGVFYYAVVALDLGIIYSGSDAVLLGDRVAPQSTTMGKGNVFIVNYADRKAGEPFTTQPSVGKSIWLLLDPQTMKLGEVAQNFEGEASVTTMKLNMKTWNWVNTTYTNGKVVTPSDPARFALTFNEASFSAGTDCNHIGGEYTTDGSKITFGRMMSTKMACMNGSQEGEIIGGLSSVVSYKFTSKGELVFSLAENAGTMTYK